VAHGPHPRDFSTGLPKKLYDIAWRTALSYRYRRGELIVVHKMLDFSEENISNMLLEEMAGLTEPFREEKVEEEEEVDGSVRVNIVDTPMEVTKNGRVRVKGGWKKARHADPPGSVKAKTTYVPQMVWVLNDPSENHLDAFKKALKQFWPRDKLRTSQTVDVKNLLEGSRVVIEKEALDQILADHQSDLKPRVDIAAARRQAEADRAILDAAVKELTKEVRGLAITAEIAQQVSNATVAVTESIERAQTKVEAIKRRTTRKKVHSVIEEV
jgi:ribosomal protein L4